MRSLPFCLVVLAVAIGASPAGAQLMQIDGALLARFAPDSLAGKPLVNPMTGEAAGAQRIVQPGAVEAAYGLSNGV